MTGNSIEKIKETVETYNGVIKILEDNRGEDQVCRLSKKKISEKLDLSYTGTLNKLKYLQRYGLIEQVNDGFAIKSKQVVEHSPLGLIPSLLLLVYEKPEVFYSFKEQAELLDIPIEYVQTAWGFYSHFFGAKNPTLEDLKGLEKAGFSANRE